MSMNDNVVDDQQATRYGRRNSVPTTSVHSSVPNSSPAAVIDEAASSKVLRSVQSKLKQIIA